MPCPYWVTTIKGHFGMYLLYSLLTAAGMVLLSILNAFLFGWVASETALITKNLIPIMIFHCLFDFLTYQMLATGNALIVIYAVRGTLMAIVSLYLLLRLKKQTRDRPHTGFLNKART